MPRPARIHRHVFVSLALPCIAAAWWGCATGSNGETTNGAGGGSSLSTSSGNGGSGGTGGGIKIQDGGGGKGGGSCTSTSAEAHPVPLDIIFMLDQSDSMSGTKWIGTTSALSSFFNNPASDAIGAGLRLFPTSTPSDCVVADYEILNVPIAPLPGNAFALTNALPADATVFGTPMWGALKGTLLAATSYQDAHPTHKVNVVLATDGDPNGCNGEAITDVAALAQSALDYDGVHTYAIGVTGATIANLDLIAAAGGTTAAYDVTQDISQFSTAIAKIRSVALGCDYEIPPPPHGKQLDPNEVNFSYTPNGVGMAQTLPRASDLADCTDQPGWYYDNNSMPTEIILCPASCSTVQDDAKAKVSVLFGCESVLN